VLASDWLWDFYVRSTDNSTDKFTLVLILALRSSFHIIGRHEGFRSKVSFRQGCKTPDKVKNS